MPGPGNNNKKKPKVSKPVISPTSGTSASSITASFSSLSLAITDADVKDVDNTAAENWTFAVQRLCEACHLPDLGTKQGLKKVYANFDTYYKRLEALHARYGEFPRVRAGIVGIYAKMCNDSLLRNKLFKKGFLEKVVPLLNSPSCQNVVLYALQTVTRHGGADVRLEIAKHAMPLTRILEDEPSDTLSELTVSVLSHSLTTAFEGKVDNNKLKPAHPALIKSLDATRIVKDITIAATKPTASSSTIYHALELLSAATLHCFDAFKAHPDATKLLIAGLRSKEWERRCTCLQALMRLHTTKAADDREPVDPMKFMSAAKRFPDHIVDELMDYGMMRCDTFLTALCTREFQDAMMQILRDKDFYALGLKIASNILRTEYSIAEGSYQFQDPVTGKLDRSATSGLPFTMWSDALPICARTLRKRTRPLDLDYADILDIKYFIMRQRYNDAVGLAMKAIERNPHQGYWYYAISMAHDPAKGLKAAKQGMRCSQLSPFVQYQLMQRAVDHAGSLGIEILQQVPAEGDQKWYEGIAFLHSALEDAKTYVMEAPPDNRNMKNVLYWYMLLMITVKDVSPDLRELDLAKKKLEMADEITRIIGSAPPPTKMRLTQQTVVQYYEEAIEQFSSVIERAGANCSEHIHPTSKESEGQLAAWLEKMDLEDNAVDSAEVLRVGEESKAGGLKVVDVDGDRLRLYRCAWCGNPSASLRKCAGCEKVRYCDSSCQKLAWMSHKKVCKKAP